MTPNGITAINDWIMIYIIGLVKSNNSNNVILPFIWLKTIVPKNILLNNILSSSVIGSTLLKYK